MGRKGKNWFIKNLLLKYPNETTNNEILGHRRVPISIDEIAPN